MRITALHRAPLRRVTPHTKVWTSTTDTTKKMPVSMSLTGTGLKADQRSGTVLACTPHAEHGQACGKYQQCPGGQRRNRSGHGDRANRDLVAQLAVNARSADGRRSHFRWLALDHTGDHSPFWDGGGRCPAGGSRGSGRDDGASARPLGDAGRQAGDGAVGPRLVCTAPVAAAVAALVGSADRSRRRQSAQIDHDIRSAHDGDVLGRRVVAQVAVSRRAGGARRCRRFLHIGGCAAHLTSDDRALRDEVPCGPGCAVGAYRASLDAEPIWQRAGGASRRRQCIGIAQVAAAQLPLVRHAHRRGGWQSGQVDGQIGCRDRHRDLSRCALGLVGRWQANVVAKGIDAHETNGRRVNKLPRICRIGRNRSAVGRRGLRGDRAALRHMGIVVRQIQ